MIKRAHECGESVDLALAEYRNTAMANSPAPSDLFYNRRLCGELPSLKTYFDRDGYVEEKQRSRDKYLSTGTCRPARGQFAVGEKVFVHYIKSTRWTIEATVESIRDSGRSYWVVTIDGGVYLRNRKFLTKNKECADDKMNEVSGMNAKSADLVSAHPTERFEPCRS